MTKMKMMNSNINKFFLMILSSSLSIAQSSFKVDTTKIFNLSHPIELLEYHTLCIVSEEFNLLALNTSFLNDTSSVWIRTRSQLGYFPDQFSPNNDLKSILGLLNQIYLKSQSLKIYCTPKN
jgi:hypothetical protein